MIKKVECYVAICDICEKSVDDGADMVVHYDTEAEALERALDIEDYGGSGCETIGGKLCCRDCWTYGDDDEPELRKAVEG